MKKPGYYNGWWGSFCRVLFGPLDAVGPVSFVCVASVMVFQLSNVFRIHWILVGVAAEVGTFRKKEIGSVPGKVVGCRFQRIINQNANSHRFTIFGSIKMAYDAFMVANLYPITQFQFRRIDHV